ncbi:MAG: hypothetical protein M0Z33_01680 [Actinomycetota bacterium]|nr:hypothetical protein [Actinomycetota bacterium]
MGLAAGLAVVLVRGASVPRPHVVASAGAAAKPGAIVAPKRPEAMAVGPKGSLYVVDGGRDQILRRLPDGRFQVVAGSGRRGLSGDGGPAVDAEIRVGHQAGIAVARNGTVYFSDNGNGRVREVLPDGVIETLAGGGSIPLGTKPVRALAASFGRPFSLYGLAIGPGGDVYLGCGEGVYRLASDGLLHWVVGKPLGPKVIPRHWGGVYANPAIESDFAPAARLALDGRGDLFVAGGGGNGLYERTVAGKLRFVESFRGEGYWGSLAPGPKGTVVLSGGSTGLARASASGVLTEVPHARLTGLLGAHDYFPSGGDVAVASNGDIYLDTDAGNGFTGVSAIVEVAPAGRARVVWEAAGS